MELISISKDEFDKYSYNHPCKTFVQTSKMGEIRKSKGWDIYYLALKDNDEILGASLLMSIPKFLGKREFYAPRGVLVDYNNLDITEKFLRLLTEYVKKNNGFMLRIDPYLIYKQRDINGEIIENGIDNTNIEKLFFKLGFNKSKGNEQLKWLYALDLEGKTEDDILKGMNKNTRNIIRKTLKTNIKLRKLSRDELKLFEKITDETGQRRGFASKNLNYYEQMDDLFKDEVIYVIAELDLKEYIDSLNTELNNEKGKLSKLSDNKANDGKKKEINVTIESLSKKITKAEDLVKTDGEKIILSGAMFMAYGDEVVYLFCGNYKKYMDFSAQYFIQWEMIKYAIKNNFKRYNFYGISGIFDKKDPSYGIYEFKKGFGGYVMELFGDYEVGTSFIYNLYKLVKGAKR